MSEYVYVIEELDVSPQTATIEVLGSNYVDSCNAELLESIKHLRPTLVLAPAFGTSDLQQMQEQAQYRPKYASSESIAQKKIDVDQLYENTNSTKQQIKWSQYDWKCFFCTFSTKCYTYLVNHLKYCHYIISNEDIRYQCSDCGRIIEEYCQFLNHIRQIHHYNLKLSCDICSISFKNYSMLAVHREFVHASHGFLRPKVYNCKQCELTFATKNEVDCHSDNHSWTCTKLNSDGTMCMQLFYSKKEYFKHKIQHAYVCKKQNGTIYFTCDSCGRRFKHREDFWSHLATHANELPHKCTHCAAHFRTEAQYLSHMESHSLLICKWCTHISHTERSHNIHMRIHQPTRETSKPDVIKTNSINTNSMKYNTCPKCGIKFARTHTKFQCLRRFLANRIPNPNKRKKIF